MPRFRVLFPSLMVALLAGAVLPGGQTDTKEKNPVFGGACRLCPWGAMAEVVQAAMKPYLSTCRSALAATRPMLRALSASRVRIATSLSRLVEGKLWERILVGGGSFRQRRLGRGALRPPQRRGARATATWLMREMRGG